MDAADRALLVVRGLDPVGTGHQVELAAAGLSAAGLAVTVAVTTAGGSVPERLAGRGFDVHRVGRRRRSDVGATARLARLARAVRPRVVLGFGRSQAARVWLASRLVPRCRGVVWIGLPPNGPSHAWALRSLDRVVASSPAVAAGCRRAGVSSGRLAIVPPGVSVTAGPRSSRGAIASRLGLDPDRTWTLAVAPLEPVARLPRLLWAIDQLGVVRKDLQHVLVGAGPLEQALRRRARSQELAERLFIVPDCGLLPDLVGEAGVAWQSGDVAVGGAILDGLARGVPVVAVESEAARQIVADGETGRIVPAVPASEFPRRVYGILEDEPLARRYAEAAATRAAAAFPAERFVAGLLAAITG